MSDEYLWDRSGMPEEDEVELENLLGGHRFQADKPAQPALAVVAERRTRWPLVVGVAVAAGALVGVGWWMGHSSSQSRQLASVASSQAPQVIQPAQSASVGEQPPKPPTWKPATEIPRTPPSWEPDTKPEPAPTLDPRAQETKAGPTFPAPKPAQRRGLTASQVRAVVTRYKPSVARRCWQRALSGAEDDAPTSVRVSVKLTVQPSGSVSNVSTGPSPKGYPGLAECIAGNARSWRFPSSDGAVTISVPFVFSRN